jgi:hypothetical protein
MINDEDIVAIDLSTYQFQPQNLEEFFNEITKLHRSAPEYSMNLVVIHSIIERLLSILKENPAEQSSILMTERNILFEIISFYQLFVIAPKSAEEKHLLKELMNNWLMIFLIVCFNYDDPYYAENGINNPAEMIISNNTLNHYHSIVENQAILDTNNNEKKRSLNNKVRSNHSMIVRTEGEEKTEADEEKAEEILTHNVSRFDFNNRPPVPPKRVHVPYFNNDHVMILTENQLITILLVLMEQIFLGESINREEGEEDETVTSLHAIFANHTVTQMNLLQLLLVLLFSKENKILFQKQHGLKILLSILTKYYNHENVSIVHNILLMIINCFYCEENIIKFGKLSNSCEVIMNVLQYHKMFLDTALETEDQNRRDSANQKQVPSLFYYHANVELLLEIIRDLSFYIDFQYEFAQLNTCPILIDVLAIYLYQPQRLNSLAPQQILLILEKSLETIICLAMNDQNEFLLGSHGIAEILYHLLKTYGFHYPKMTENAFNAIRNLSKNNENKLKFSSVGMCELIVKLLTHYIHITNKQITSKGPLTPAQQLRQSQIMSRSQIIGGANPMNSPPPPAAAHHQNLDEASDTHSMVSSITGIQSTTREGGSSSNKPPRNAPGAVNVPLSSPTKSTMGVFFPNTQHHSVQELGESSPVSPAVNTPTSNNNMNNMSVYSVSNSSAQNEPQFANIKQNNPIMEIIKSALSAITNLSVLTDNKMKFGLCQTCELIVIVLYLFGKQSADITKKALAAIGNLSVINENKVRFANNISTNISNQMVTLNSFEILVQLLNRFALQNIEISKKGLAAIGNLSVNHENKMKLGVSGANGILVDILQTYAQANEEVAQNGLGALANLAAYAQNNRELMTRNIDALIMEIMRFYDKKYLPHHHVNAQSNTTSNHSFYGKGNDLSIMTSPSQKAGARPQSQQFSYKAYEHDFIYLEILKNGFGAINKFIAGNTQLENLKKFSESYELPDLMINLLKKIIVNHRELQTQRKIDGGKSPSLGLSSPSMEAPPVNYDDLAHSEIVKQMLQTISHLIVAPKNVKKLRNLGLKELLKKYFSASEKANEIVVKISRTNSLFW